MIIYTDEDIRPDLLTPSERERFPETLDNNDRRAILTITRARMDNVDMDGHPMPSAEEWIAAYGTPEAENRPEYRMAITRTVANPYTAETAEVPAGIAETVQRLLDRGIAVDTDRCESYMVTDHPGSRWINEKGQSDDETSVTPGENMYLKGRYLPFIEFPVDNAKKGMNTDRMAGLIKKAAAECGLVIEESPNARQNMSKLRLTFPYCLDGTSQEQALKETNAMALTLEPPRDYQKRRELYGRCLDTIRFNHGGIALYSDAMIQDRFTRFARSLERLIIQNPDLIRREVPGLHHEDYLTHRQMDNIQNLCDQFSRDLYDKNVRPYAYRQYADAPETVDAVAQQAGYTSYIDFLDNQRVRTGTPDKRWSEFRRLEQQLHPDLQGRLLLFRLSEGIRRQAMDGRNEWMANGSAQTERLYRSCGYPLDRLGDITFIEREDGAADMYLMMDGKPVVRQVSPDEMKRLSLNGATPFEVALRTCGHEVGWTYKTHILVSEDTLHAVTSRWQQTGNHPLVDNRTHDVYPVSEAAWEHAHLLTRYEQLPPSLADKVATRSEAYKLPVEKLRQRIQKISEDAARSVAGIQADGAKDDRISFNYRYKEKLYHDTLTTSELDFTHKLLPGVAPDRILKELFAGKAVSQEQQIERSGGRSR